MSSDRPSFDADELLASVEGDRSFLAEALQLLEADAPRLLAELLEAVARRDAGLTRTVAHTLKGMVDNFSAAPAHAAVHRLESLGREGDLAEAPAALAALELEVERLLAALRQFIPAT